jgi:crotonobetainyl-CoA:carnitine CoA-transferase CaiB-like acyl-CoA transferase
MARQPFEGIKAVEYATFIAAPYCARFLADFGAEVIKIEEPGSGDESRRRGPFPKDEPHPEKSGLFCYLNWNKFGVTLNIGESSGREIFERLIKEADVLIEDTLPGKDAKLGIDYKTLSKLNPRLIVTSITPFGKTGSYKNYKAYPLTLAHGSGAGYLLPCGDTYLAYPDREPIKSGGFVGEYNAGETAIIATIAALYWREISGKGQYVDVSRREAITSLSRYELSNYNKGFIENRASRTFPIGGLMCCKDGFVEISLMNKQAWLGLIKLIGNPEWAQKEEYQFEKIIRGFMKQEEVDQQKKQEVNDFITCWMLEHTKDEIYHQGQACGVAVTKVANTQDVVESRQYNARNYFITIDHPELGSVKFPSWPCKFSQTSPAIHRPAPLLGEHNEQVYTQLGYSAQDLVCLKAAGVI